MPRRRTYDEPRSWPYPYMVKVARDVVDHARTLGISPREAGALIESAGIEIRSELQEGYGYFHDDPEAVAHGLISVGRDPEGILAEAAAPLSENRRPRRASRRRRSR